MTAEMKVTIYDVANEAGVSIATVSRYLNNKGVVAKKSEEKIVAAIKKLNYIPDTLAQNLASGQSRTVAMLISKQSLNSEYYCEFMSGVYNALSTEAIDVILLNEEMDVRELEKRIRKGKKADGAITAHITRESDIKYLLDREIPFVYAGKRLSFDEDGHNVYGGFSDYRKSVASIFVDRGCQKMLVIDVIEQDSERSRAALAEFEDAMEIEYHYISSDTEEDSVYQYLQDRLSQEDRPDCIFYTMASWTSQVYLAAIACGLEIGKDLKVMSLVHAKQKNVRFVPDLSVVLVDARQMGYQAGQKMMRQLRGEPINRELTMIPYRMIMNESV